MLIALGNRDLNEWVDYSALHEGLSAFPVDTDCLLEILSWLPLDVWSSCSMCGFPLVRADCHGRMSVSEQCVYSYETCKTCYFREY